MIWCESTVDGKQYALCAEPNCQVFCRDVSSLDMGLVDEKYLWTRIGNAIVSKPTGRVLEASAELRKPIMVRSSSNPLRPSQAWAISKNGKFFFSKNNRRLELGAIVPPDAVYQGAICIVGDSFESPLSDHSSCYWRLKTLPSSSVSELMGVSSYPVCGAPQQKVIRLIHEEDSFVKLSSGATIPGDGEIDLRILLFRKDFARLNNPTYKELTDEQLEKEWEEHGIQNGAWGSPVFNVKFYSEQVRSKVTDYTQAVEYFLKHFNEHIQTSEKFDWHVYRQNNPDLRRLTPKQLFYHFYMEGYDSGRRAT